MKKRLLITSIVMMLVVAVALSTATYAWFTSNAAVTASTITLTAESNAGAALGIAWVGDGASSSITANDPAGDFKPMVPSALVVDTGSNTPTNFSAVTWSGATMRTEGGVAKFNEVYSNPAPYQYNGTVSAATVDTFFIENLSASNAIAANTVTLSLAELADTNELLRVAVFTSTASDGQFALRAVLAKTANAATAYGSVVEDAEVNNLCTTPVLATTSYVIPTALAANHGKLYFKVVAWLDGVVLDDGKAESTSTFGLRFAAA